MDEHLQMIADCEARDSRLSDWERGFIDSISHLVESGVRLTEKQAQTLETIWEQVTGNG